MNRLALLFLFSSAGVASAQPASIPTQFRGEWNASVAQCADEDSDGRLVIGVNTLQFYESSGLIRALEIGGRSEITLIARMTGEGKSWTQPYQFRLTADGSRLMDTTGGRTAFMRYRCGAKR